MAEGMGGLRSDTEERYAALKARLKEHSIGGLLPVQAVPLVERLFNELLASQEREKVATTNGEQARNEYLSSEQQLQPLKEDNVRLLHENNALHLELIHEAEREDEAHQQLQIQADKLKTRNQQLAFLNSQYRQKAEAAEAEAAKLRERVAELSDQLATGATAAAAERKPRAMISRPIAEAVPGEQAADDSTLDERIDLLKVKDAQLAKLESLVNASSEQNEALEVDLRTVLQKVSARDQEIERLNQLLDGGQDYQKLSFEHVNKSNQQLVANLNENVQFLTSQIVNLENEVLHRQGLQEEGEKQSVELTARVKTLEAELRASQSRSTELQETADDLRQQLETLAAETNEARAFAQGRGKDLEEQIERLTKKNLEAGLRAQSLTDTSGGAFAISQMQSEMERLRQSSGSADKKAAAAAEEISTLKKEVSGLNSDLDTARRELLRARREKESFEAEANKLRSAAADGEAAVAAMQTNSKAADTKLEEAESAMAALRNEVTRLSTELLDKDTEFRNAAAARDRIEIELQKLRSMEADVTTYKSSAAAAREAASVQETNNLRLQQENARLEEMLRAKTLDEHTMQESVRRKENEKETMQQSLDKLKSENRELQAQSDSLREERNSLSTLYSQVKEQLQVLQRERAVQGESQGETETRLRERVSELEIALHRANEETSTARQAAEMSRSTSQQLATESTTLAKTVSDLRQGRADAQREVDRLSAKQESLERSLAAQSAELTRSQTQGKARQQEVEQMRVLFTQIDATRAELVDKLERERARASRVEEELKAAVLQQDKLRGDLSSRDKDLERANTALAKLDAERDNISSELDNVAERKASMQEAFAQAEARQLEAERARAEVESTLQATIGQRDALAAEAAGLRQAMQQAQAANQQLEEELALKSNEVVAMSEDLVNVTAENQSINAELTEVVSSRDQAREQMGAMELRLGHAESGVMMKETEYKELLASYRVVVDSNAQLLEAVQQAETESEQMRATQAALQGELANARGAVAERENTKYVADEQLASFRQQSEEYTQLSRNLRDELAQAKAAQVEAEQSAAAAASLRTAADVSNTQLQRQLVQHEQQLATMQVELERKDKLSEGLQLRVELQQSKVEELEGLLATLRSQAGVAAGTLVDDRTKQESLLARVTALEGSKAELARKLAEAEARLQTRSVTAADPPLELQRAVTAALAERDEARAALEKLRDESARSGGEASLADQGTAGELASLRSQLEALRAQSAQDDAYKLQTMQYLRKYEAELQKKEKQLTELRQQLQTGGTTGASENRR